MSAIARALTIAGSDSSGGAGIQADLKTFAAFGVYGMSALTAITAQNTTGVSGVEEVSTDLIARQIDAVAEDVGVDAAKTGMLSSSANVLTVAERVRRWAISNLVVDPVMVSKSGAALLTPEAQAALREQLLPLALVVTPNTPEAEVLTGLQVNSLATMREAAVRLHAFGARWVVVKGGHMPEGEDVIDLVYDGATFTLLRSPRIATKNTHGTGCTFAAAITACLACGLAPLDAIRLAKRYISRAIESALPLGRGHGPTNHLTGVVSEWALAAAGEDAAGDHGSRTHDRSTAGG